MVAIHDILATSHVALEHVSKDWGIIAQQTTVDPRQWTRLLVALLVIVVVGFVLIACVLAWGRRMRRVLRRGRGHSRMSQDAWYAKPLVPDADGTREKTGD